MPESHDTTFAGCAPPGRIEDIRGRRFNRLTVIGYSHRHHRAYRYFWLCRCDCGRESIVSRNELVSGSTGSCGCLGRESRIKHGMSGTREYSCWENMITRCTVKSHRSYGNYGGSGVRVCLEWMDSFEAFYEHIGPCPSPRHSVDRFPDRGGSYEPGNVRWATPGEQARNKRNNIMITIGERTQCVADWAHEVGLSHFVIRWRISQGSDPEYAVMTPAISRQECRMHKRLRLGQS